MSLLKRIIDSKTAKREGVFLLDEQESRFKRCLAKVKTTCRIEKYDGFQLLCIRPVNVGDFKKKLEDNGMGNCDLAMITVGWLEANPGESIRFRTEI